MKRTKNKHNEMLVKCSMADCTIEEVLFVFYGSLLYCFISSYLLVAYQ